MRYWSRAVWLSASLQETCIITKNLTIHFNIVIYQIPTNRPSIALRKIKVIVCQNAHGEITILYNKKPLDFTTFHIPVRQS